VSVISAIFIRWNVHNQ